MKLSFANNRLLAVMAHPDDAELLCAGTLARAAAEGAAIGVCVMCNGDKGVASSAPVASGSLAAVRRAEAEQAIALLKAQLFWFECGDGELFDSTESRRKLVEIFRQFRPTLVIAHAPEDYHPDHRAASAIAEAASWFGALRGHVTGSPPLDGAPALWFADTLNMSGFSPEFYIDITAHVPLKESMLACHKSQLARQGDADFPPLLALMRRQYEARSAQAGAGAAEAFRQHHALGRARAW